MAPKPGGIQRPPNHCEIKFRVISVTRSEQFPNKRELEFELLDARHLDGPDLISRKVGETGTGFTFDDSVALSVGSVVRAKAQLLGDALTSLYELSELQLHEG